MSVLARVDGAEDVADPFVLDPRGLGGVDHASGDGDELSGEESLIGLPVLAVHGDGGVTPNASADVHGECVAEFGFIEVVGPCGGGEDRLRRLAHKRSVRGAMVVLVEEGAEAHVEVVERAEGACEVEAALAEGAPEALHFPSRRRVVGLGVQEGRPHAGASEGERVAAVGGPVVEVNSVGGAMFAHGTHEQAEHVDLSLLVHGLERDDVPRGVVEHAVNAHGLFLAADQELSPMADVAVPERAGMRSLPSETLLAVDAISQRALIETAGGKEAAQRGGGEDVGVQASIGDERIEDPLGRGARPLAANVAEEILLLGGEGPRGPPIGAWLGPQGGKSPFLYRRYQRSSVGTAKVRVAVAPGGRKRC